MARARDSEVEQYIVDGMAQALWVQVYTHWATKVEPPPTMGSTWEEMAGPVPDAASDAARELARVFARANAKTKHVLAAMFEAAVRDRRPAHSTLEDRAFWFGETLALACMSVRDLEDHVVAALRPLGIVLPSMTVELTDDGDEMVWDVRTDGTRPTGFPAGPHHPTRNPEPPCGCQHNPSTALDVLLIEDDKALQKATTRMIKKLFPPAEVLVADNYLSAIGILETHVVKLVVSDVNILGARTGIDVFEWVKENQPHLVDKYVFFTGGNPQVESMHYRYLEKPAMVEDLRAVIWKPAPGAPAVARTTTGVPRSALAQVVSAPSSAALTPKEVAQRVNAALPSVTGAGRFGPDKVFISAMWRHLSATDPQIHAMGEARFKRALVDAQIEDHLLLSRADLPEAMDQREVAASQIVHMGDELHFIIDRPRRNPGGNPRRLRR